MVIVGSLFIAPPGAVKRPTVHPVYTVDLVGGAGPQPPAGRMPAATTDTPPPPRRTDTETAAPKAPQKEAAQPEPAEPEPAEPEPQVLEPEPKVAQPEPKASVPEPVTEEEPERPTESQDVAKAPDPPQEPVQMAKPEPDPAPSEKPAATPKEKAKPDIEKAKPDIAKPKVQQRPKPSEPKKKVAASAPKKKVAKKKPAKPRKRPQAAGSAETKRRTEVSNRDEAEVQRLRERRIQAAVAKVRERARNQSGSSVVAANDSAAQRLQAGTGRGRGAGVGDEVGDGGGELKSLEFVIYRNRMLDQIKNRWTWVGKHTDLEVTVRFGVDSNGDVFALQIVGASGDRTYDESVIRAVRRASPLPPPPTTYLRDFSDVELTFRPKDLSG